jgi:hypothetical protein
MVIGALGQDERVGGADGYEHPVGAFASDAANLSAQLLSFVL